MVGVAAPRIRSFIAQDESTKVDMSESLAGLAALFESNAVVLGGSQS